MNETIRVLIVDDHPIVREGLRALIDFEEDMEVVGTGENGTEAIQQSEILQPDILLLDLVMPHGNGVGAIRDIKRVSPSTRILVLTAFGEDSRIFPAIEAGASGYLLKDILPSELLQAIRDTFRGCAALHPLVAHKLIHKLYHPTEPNRSSDRLTKRESEVLKLVAQGLSNHEIAAQLVIGEDTVRSHVSSILHKLKLENRTAAALHALREGLVPLSADDLAAS